MGKNNVDVLEKEFGSWAKVGAWVMRYSVKFGVVVYADVEGGIRVRDRVNFASSNSVPKSFQRSGNLST